MEINVNISIPHLWGEERFSKKEWGYFNVLIGPNGSGKTLFITELKKQIQRSKFIVRHLSPDRLTGFTGNRYRYQGMSNLGQGFSIDNLNDIANESKLYGLSGDSFGILLNKPHIRIKVTATLNQLFSRDIRIVEKSGFVDILMKDFNNSKEYRFIDNESHGLKELVTLLTYIFDDSNTCVIIDEPELHFHPQLQQFVLNLIRNQQLEDNSDFTEKLFIIATHSPFFVDIRDTEDLKNIILFRKNKLPLFLENVSKEDNHRLMNLIPRLNTHHKQLFFADSPIFVEGYSDQQFLSLLLNKMEKPIGANGNCIINVDGKDELDYHYRLCKAFDINCRIIADLDLIFRSKLRQTISSEKNTSEYLNKEGLGNDLMKYIGGLEQLIDRTIKTTDKKNLKQFDNSYFNGRFGGLPKHKARGAFAQLAINHTKSIQKLFPKEALGELSGKINRIHLAFKENGIFILPKGQIENYFQSCKDAHMISGNNKRSLFNSEYDYLLKMEGKEQINKSYSDLLHLMDEAMSVSKLDFKPLIIELIQEFIHRTQMAFTKEKIHDLHSLRTSKYFSNFKYTSVFKLISFESKENSFKCELRLNTKSGLPPKTLVFDEKQVPADFDF